MALDQLYKLIENSTSIWDSAMITIQAIFYCPDESSRKTGVAKTFGTTFSRVWPFVFVAEKD